jgi:hypothetical protein
LKGLLLVSMVAVWVSLAQPLAALAEPSGVHLEWWRPPGSTCPTGPVIERDVEQALGRRIFTSARTAELHVHASVEDRASGVRVRLEARSPRGRLLGTRELRAPPGECAGLRSDIDLVLMLLVEGTDHAAPESARLRLGVGLWAGLIVHALPRATGALGPLLTLDLGAYAQLRVDAAYWLPVAVQTSRGIRADMQAASLALRVCPSIAGSEHSVLLLRLCSGVQLGALIASQTRPEGPAPQLRVLSEVLLELRAGLRVGSLGTLELAAGPTLALSRPSIVAVHSDASRVLLFRPPTFGMIVALGFSL